MLKHYILIYWRNILRNKFYSVILVTGLAIGIASSLLLGIYTWNELTYDNFHQKKDRIFLVGVYEKEGANEGKGGWTTPPTGPALKEFFPAIEASVRLCTWFDDVLVLKEGIQRPENNIVGADSSVFSVFTFPFISGDPGQALREPNSIVITESIAKKYFGSNDPIGQTLEFNHFFKSCQVTGVIKDLPANSHFKADIFLSLSTLKAIDFDFNNWSNHTFSTYVVLNEKSNSSDVESRLPLFVKESLGPYLRDRFNKTYDEIYSGGNAYSLFLVPLKDVHLSTLLFENREGKRTLIYALGAISVIILLMVTINYTNLATVLTFSRAKEVGIRKVTGSKSGALFKQFLMEAVLMVFIGVFIALALVELILPIFNSFANQRLTFEYSNPFFVGGLLVFGIALGLASGFYPALKFSSFNPIRALKGNVVIKNNNAWIRNPLVVFQFTICVVMIVSTLIVYKQLSFMSNLNVGFDKDQILVIKRPGGLGNNKVAFKNQILQEAGVRNICYTETTPGRHFNGHGQHFAGTPSDEIYTIFPLVADEDIFETLDLKLAAGTDFKSLGARSGKAILNEAAVRLLNIENPLNLIIDRGTLGKTNVDVIGVVKDFHFKSFHFAIEPLVIYPLDVENDSQHRATFILVKMDGKNIPATLENIERVWKKRAVGYPFEYSFLDEDFNRLFEKETTMMQVYTIFSIISISIACLGLLGLASFMVNKRTKEIGIRKIVGASFLNIAAMLSLDYFKWIMTAVVIGSLLSWYLMKQWLQNFAYATALSWWVFLIAGGCLIAIAFFTVSWHLYNAARRNPVETLRYE